MSYQVLARKWRPQNFQEMAGQEHVLKALSNALNQDRLHHAYLFTGTRGVGKTTVARILAKCLNCEGGVSATPCGECTSCREVTEGRFVDLIEIDAASRTKVEDMRELLDNVQYAPTRGRFKIYLIDEVHMLSNSSFNALLKTLEEPPPHIKFLLATTDPQKLPVTVLSRCLQFNLKNLSPERIVKHLNAVLTDERTPYENSALWELARAAQGSMRDALSLADQAIAFGGGELKSVDVVEMLGTIDRNVVADLAAFIVNRDAQGLLQRVALLAEHSPDFSFVLDALIELFYQVAVEQAVPGAIDDSFGNREQIRYLASGITAEDAQLFYQIALMGRKDLPLAPSPRIGFEMALLRMLAFQPDFPPQEQLELPQSQGKGKRKEETDQSEKTLSDLSESDKLLKKSAPKESGSGAAHNQTIKATISKEVIEEAPTTSGLDTATAAAPGVEEDVDQASFRSLVDEYQTMLSQEERTQSSVDESIVSENDVVQQNLMSQDVEEQLGNQPPDVVDHALPSESVSVEDHCVEIDSSVSEVTSSDDNVITTAAADITPINEGAIFNPITDNVEQLTDIVEQNAAGADKKTAESPHGEDDEPTLDGQTWERVFSQLNVTGMTQNLVQRCALAGGSGSHLDFLIDADHAGLFVETHVQRLKTALSEFLGREVTISVKAGKLPYLSPQQLAEERRAAAQRSAEQAIKNDPNVQGILGRFDAVILSDSTQPV